MAFIETQLLSKVAYGFVGGASFSTTRVELFSGIVARNAERSLPLYRYSAPYDRIKPADHEVVVAAFNACLGGLHSFRFKDWADYSETAGVLGTAAGGAGETIQLVKVYTFGSTTLSRTIKKPVTGTVQLYEDAVALASSVDTTTGICTFTSSAGKVITADFEFDTPVMFSDDDLQFSFANWEAHSTDVNLMEDLSA